MPTAEAVAVAAPEVALARALPETVIAALAVRLPELAMVSIALPAEKSMPCASATIAPTIAAFRGLEGKDLRAGG